MYTKEQDSDDDNLYSVLDPEGDIIISGIAEGVADTLLSHLNR